MFLDVLSIQGSLLIFDEIDSLALELCRRLDSLKQQSNKSQPVVTDSEEPGSVQSHSLLPDPCHPCRSSNEAPQDLPKSL